MRPKKIKLEKREFSKRKGFKFTSWSKEDHKEPIFGVAFNPYNHPDHPPTFATVGSNRVTVYECTENGIKVIQSYSDPCTEEIFYTVCWVYNETSEGEIETSVAVAGLRGLIRVVSLKKLKNLFTLMGCGDSINELKLHPVDNNLLLSASKDNSLRLWNLKTRRGILIFGGLAGHRDEVLSCDFDLQARYVLSCGMDHSVKMWSLESEDVKTTVNLSYTYKDTKPFPVLNKHFPVFSTRNIHRNYVDCVRWFGNFVLSKSCENKIVCWKPNLTTKKSSDIPDQSEVLHSFDYGNCDIWYMRFAVSPNFDAIAAGNQIGKVFLWDISEEPSKPAILSHQKCSTAIRQACFSPDSNIMVTVSDDSAVWRWDREAGKRKSEEKRPLKSKADEAIANETLGEEKKRNKKKKRVRYPVIEREYSRRSREKCKTLGEEKKRNKKKKRVRHPVREREYSRRSREKCKLIYPELWERKKEADRERGRTRVRRS